MAKVPKISESEWEVLKIIWDKNPITAVEIIEKLGDEVDWSSQTIKTYINRLVKKDVIGFEKVQRHYNYFPKLTEQECVKAESSSFLKRVFNGTASAMVSNFIEEGHLSDDDISKLEEILKEKKK